jgi:ribose/xylose/arabinose/galactoside ABC-type transport system permease subunit
MTEIINGLKIMGVQPFWQSALPGAALLAALILQRVMGRSDVWASE